MRNRPADLLRPVVLAACFVQVLGTPTRVQIEAMNPNYTDFKFPQIKAHPWGKVFRSGTPPEAIELCQMLLEYTPVKRVHLIPAMAHPFFDDIRKPDAMHEGQPQPELFNFTEAEHKAATEYGVLDRLVPAHYGR